MADDFVPDADFTPDDDFKPDKPTGLKDTAIDVAKSFPTGVVKGVAGIAGAPGDLQNLKGSDYNPFNWLTKKAAEVLPTWWTEHSKQNAERAGLGEGMKGETGLPSSAQIEQAVKPVTGELHKPETTAGEYAQTAGEFAPNMLGPGGLWRKAFMQWLGPAAATETAGQLTKGTAAEPYARGAASLITPYAMSRVRTPINTSPGRADMVDDLVREGVTGLTAGQRTGSKNLRYFESVLGDYPGAGEGATHAQTRANEQFTQATLARLGVPRNMPPTRAILDQRIEDLGTTFNQISARNNANLDRQFTRDISNVETRYQRKLDSQQRQIFYDILGDIQNYGHQMPGTVYQPLRSDLTKMAFGARDRDPLFADAIRGLRNALDGAMGRSISALDRNLWERTRREWGNWKTVAGAAKNTDEAGHILITPAALKQAASAKNREAFARGDGPFANLAQAGSTVMRQLPQSGTQPRHVAVAIPSVIGSVLAAPHAGPEAAIAAMAGLAGPAVAGRALMSRPVQRYLANRGEMGHARDTRTRALLREIEASTDQREKP